MWVDFVRRVKAFMGISRFGSGGIAIGSSKKSQQWFSAPSAESKSRVRRLVGSDQTAAADRRRQQTRGGGSAESLGVMEGQWPSQTSHGAEA